jgi:selenocysteine lyase/cysteine desulfurase
MRDGDSGGIRLCPHIYNTVEEINRAVDAVASLKSTQISLSQGI